MTRAEVQAHVQSVGVANHDQGRAPHQIRTALNTVRESGKQGELNLYDQAPAARAVSVASVADPLRQEARGLAGDVDSLHATLNRRGAGRQGYWGGTIEGAGVWGRAGERGLFEVRALVRLMAGRVPEKLFRKTSDTCGRLGVPINPMIWSRGPVGEKLADGRLWLV